MPRIKKTENMSATSEEVMNRDYAVCEHIPKLHITFPNEDMNKLVEHINKITTKLNKC